MSILENTDKFRLDETEESLILLSKEDAMSVTFTGPDKTNLKRQLARPLKPSESLNKRLNRIFHQALKRAK